MLTKELLLWNYAHIKNYNNDDQNAVGATTSLTFRTAETISGDTAYVRKIGMDYVITQVTDIEDPIDVNIQVSIYAADGTRLGTRRGGGAFFGDPAVSPQGCYMEIYAHGAMTVPASLVIDTDVDAGGLTLALAAENQAMSVLRKLYISDTGSTYYDETYIHGGARHTPVLDNSRKPYFTIASAYAALNSANDGVVVLDSVVYDEELTFDRADTVVQAALGQTPSIIAGVGARITRDISKHYDNTNAIYFNKNGDDANSGTWQEPKLTLTNAIANRGTNDVVYGGSGCGGNGVFEENVVINAGFSLESDYRYICSVTSPTGTICVDITAIDGSIYGIKAYGGRDGIRNSYLYAGPTAPIIKDCTCYNNDNAGINFNNPTNPTVYNGSIENCLCYSNVLGIKCGVSDTGSVLNTNIKKCICYNNSESGIAIWMTDNVTADIENNVCYDNKYGISMLYMVSFTGTIKNNTCHNNEYGIGMYAQTAFNVGTVTGLICRNNTISDLYSYHPSSPWVTPTITYSNYGTNDGWTIGTGCSTVDPKLCKTTSPYKLGISADSPCYKTDTSNNDKGAYLKHIIIGASDIVINGFIIDGQSQYNNAVSIVDTDNDIGLKMKWCTVDNYQGIQLDLYDNNTNIDAKIKNCIIRNGGNGIKFCYGGNTVEECLIYNNAVFGIHTDYTTQLFNHNVFCNNQYGIYFKDNVSGSTVKNCIFHLNNQYGIYSENTITAPYIVNITYCCISDAIHNVDISDTSNISDSPLLVNTEIGEENLHIKTIELKYYYNSPCKNTADDGKDMGAWDVVRSTAENYWKKYLLDFNPQVTWGNTLKGYITFTNADGNSDNYAKDSKRIFSLDFGKRNQVSSEIMRQKMEYFSTLIKMRKNDVDDISNIFRLHLSPTSFLLNGTGTVSDKTITHAQTIAENHFKGFHMGIKYASDTGTITASTKKLAVTPSPAWVDDEWIGYYVFHNGYYYYVLDNDGDELTLSDPHDTLSDGSTDFSIEKYFKIESNTEKGVFTLIDDANELIDGTYDYYINFIEVKIYNPKFNYTQPIFNYKKEHSKTGYKLLVEEC